VMLMAASVVTLQLASSAQYVLTNMKSGGTVDRSLPPWLLSDHGQGGAHLWWLTLDLTHRLAAKGREGQPFTTSEVYWFETLLRAVDRHVAERPSGIRLKSLTLIMRDELATEMGDPQFDRLREWEVPTWSQKLMAMVEERRSGSVSPHRSSARSSTRTMRWSRSISATICCCAIQTIPWRCGSRASPWRPRSNGVTWARRGCCGPRTPASSG
jgi:hypothetical protein